MDRTNPETLYYWFDQVWTQRNAAAIDELLLPESVCYTDDGAMRGPDEFKDQMHTPFLAAFADLKVEVVGMLSEGDQVVTRWIATGRHTGAGFKFAPTGAAVTFRGITWCRLRDGKMVEAWQSSNIPEVLRSLAVGEAG
jgi:predicted ester cyclase